MTIAIAIRVIAKAVGDHLKYLLTVVFLPGTSYDLMQVTSAHTPLAKASQRLHC